MIYLRPSRRITPPEEADPLMGHLSILDEYLQGVQRARTPFALVIESEHGSDLDKDGVRETVLHLRIYGHDGSDLTDLLPADFAPEWYQGEAQVGVGMSLALTWQDVKKYSTTYSVTLTAKRIYLALAHRKVTKQSELQYLSEINCRGEFVLQGSIRLISDRLEFVASSLSSARKELEKKLSTSDFESFKAGDFKSASDRLTSAESSLKSHTTALSNKLEASTFNSFKQQIGTLPTGKTLVEQVHELPTSSKVSEMLDDRDRNNYTVKVFIDGQIRNGKMDVGNPKDPTTQQPAVLHSAMANNLLMGQASADFYNGLKWTINKGRTTAPLERTVTGSRCYVLAKDIVTPTDGSVPYYDIQLERLT